MNYRYFGLFILSWLLAACGLNTEQSEIMSTTALIATEASNFPFNPTVSPTPPLTAKNTIVPTTTATPTPILFPDLGGSQAWIEKNFKLYGFQFSEPYGDNERTASTGRLVLHKSDGDLYDMEMQILTTNIGYSLIRSNFLVVVNQPLSEKEMDFVLELFRLLWATSTNTDGNEAADWINATLPALTLNSESKTNFGKINTRINVMPVEISASQKNLGYSLTLWVDPVSTTVGEAIHISVEAITPLEGMDQLRLKSWDYEDSSTVTWTTSPACVPNCATNHPNVFVSDTKITVYEGFPVTYDQWSINAILDNWGEAKYQPYTYQLKIVFHDRTYACTNSQEFNWNENMGEAGIFVEMRDGEQQLYTDDPVGMICMEE